MDHFELDRFTVKDIYDRFRNHLLTLQPSFQRERIWSDEDRCALIESINLEYPIGLVMWNTLEHVDADGVKVDKFDVVDGQQRLRTVIEYIEGAEWAKVKKIEDFKPFDGLTQAGKNRFWQYRIPVASMKGFEQGDIEECYERLQHGKPLKIGEKLKAKTTSDFYSYIKQIASHRIFGLDKRLQMRDGHWNLAVGMFKSVYGKNLFARHEYRNLLHFLRDHANEKVATKTLETCRRILNLETKVLELAIKEKPEFAKYYIGTQRTIKWLFVALATVERNYAIRGRELSIAKGMLNYYNLITKESLAEWKNYVNTGRTGRIDSDDVKRCLGDLTNQMILFAEAEPLDPQRFFNSQMRETIFKNSDGNCQNCNTRITLDNFHADHKIPHSNGGPTVVANGQALCTACNYKKGSTWKEVLQSSDDDET